MMGIVFFATAKIFFDQVAYRPLPDSQLYNLFFPITVVRQAICFFILLVITITKRVVVIFLQTIESQFLLHRIEQKISHLLLIHGMRFRILGGKLGHRIGQFLESLVQAVV